MSRIQQLFDRWKTDYDVKTVITALGSLAVTAVFALYNGFLGISHASLWHGTICVYYIVLTALRGVILAARNRVPRAGEPERAQAGAYLVSAGLLLFLNLCLVIPVSLLVVRQRPLEMTLIPAIAMAAYTTYKIIMASVNLKRRTRSADRLVRLLRTISFIDALVSILTLQNTLIMVRAKGVEHLPPVSGPNRCFFRLRARRAPARLPLSAQKSLDFASLAGASQFSRSEWAPRQGESRRKYLLYFQDFQRSMGVHSPAKTGKGSTPFAPTRRGTARRC